jgi:hypothetical protein
MAIIATSDLRAYIGTASTTADDQLSNAVSAAEDMINNTCRRSFEGTTGTRYYRESDIRTMDLPGGKGAVLLRGEELLALGGITNGNETTIASTDCWIEPRNADRYSYIRLKTGKSWVFNTDGEVEVSGTWGYSLTPPDDIIDATKQLASYYYQLRSNSVYDVVASPESGTITIPKGIPASVRKIITDGGYIRQRGII